MIMTEPDTNLARLTVGEAGELSALLMQSRAEYLAHFHPFGFEEESVRGQMEGARRDQYWGIRCGGRLAGFFMLRGFDEGYERPAFGVFVAEEFARRGLARRALTEAMKWCEENAVREMMLTVYRENTAAVRIYEEAGFVETGRNRTKIVMTKELKGMGGDLF
jgi:RimJ/RimL family protein N-acetyltransferase